MPHLEHIGIAVTDPEAVANLFNVLLERRPYKQESVAREGVQTHFIAAGTAKLELLEALGPDSPVARFLEKRGEGLHHLAFEVADIHAQMHRLRERGFTPLSDTPRPGADGKLIFFLHPKETHGVLVEFCQNTPTPLPATAIAFHNGYVTAYTCGHPDNPTVVVLPKVHTDVQHTVESLMRRLEPSFHVLALDFAESIDDAPPTTASWSLGSFANQIRAALDFFEIDQAHLVGFAEGGLLALRVARSHPQRVGKLAVHGLSFDNKPPLAPSLNQIEHPTLVSSVDRDEHLPVEACLALKSGLPNSTLAILPGTNNDLSSLNLTLYTHLLTQHFGSP